MFRLLNSSPRRGSERDRLIRDYLAILRLEPYLIRDIGLDRSEIHARLDALNVPV